MSRITTISPNLESSCSSHEVFYSEMQIQRKMPLRSLNTITSVLSLWKLSAVNQFHNISDVCEIFLNIDIIERYRREKTNLPTTKKPTGYWPPDISHALFLVYNAMCTLCNTGPMIQLQQGPLQWRHNESDGVSNNRCLDCLIHPLFNRRSKKTSKLHVTGLCEGNSPVTGEFPAQRASNAENVSI